MEDLKAQKKIINLGKSLVKELELDPGVDTLAKWMAHYVAEKIKLAEKLTGKEKKHAEKECFQYILKLWENRWSSSRGNSFLRDFEPLFETLEKLSPNKETPFFYLPQIQSEFEKENKKEDMDEAARYFDTALRVDKLARSLIFDLLNQAISGLQLTGERGELIRNAIELVDYPDTRIISVISNYNEFQESQEDDQNDETKERIDELVKRINDLEEFTEVRDSLLDRYKKELSEIKE